MLFRTSRVSRWVWFAIPIAITGIYLMSDPRGGGMTIGDWLTIGCALAFALQMVVLEAMHFRDDEIWEVTFVQMLVVGAVAFVMMLQEPVVHELSSGGYFAVIFNGIFGGAVAVWLQTRYQPRVPAGYAAMIFILEPVFAGLFASALLSDIWTGRAICGAVLIVGAMAVSSRQ
jgi:drug/metabolite transporter (DMT)-like permease